MGWLDYWPLPWRLYGAVPLRILIALCLIAVLLAAVTRFDPGQIRRNRLR